MSKISVFGLKIENISLFDASRNIILAASARAHQKIYFVNAHCVNVAAMNKDYLSVLQKADLLFADGIGMRLAAQWAGLSLVDNVNGTDLFPLICRDAAMTGVRIALLGARPGVARRCAENMKIQYSSLNIVWTHDGYFKPDSEADIISAINDSGAQILFVAMGVPMQELWIARHAESLRVPVVLGVGALFDFYSGTMPRAPLLMRQWGLEWLFRLMLEPRRLFRRYVLGNPIFIFRALWRRLRGKEALQKNPLQKKPLPKDV